MNMSDYILVAVDGSVASQRAVQWAANTAHKRGVVLRLAAAYSIPEFLYAEGLAPPEEVYAELKDEAMEKIEQARELAVEIAPDLEIDHMISQQSPIHMLLDASADASMIVMGSRGLGGFSGMVLGSVSAAVVSHAQCPVVVLRSDNELTEENKYGPVVVGIDGSEISKKATEFAFAEAKARGVKVIALHTWVDTHMQGALSAMALGADIWADIEKEQHKVVREQLAPALEHYPDVEVETVITHDRPVHALAEIAKQAQLLVVGSHGRGGFKGMLLGSTSRALLHSAPCPLVVVRPTE
ncbi:universal stress protein [Corynebacterium sp. sy039]|uniref:universal stress protein n=1 Tax=Corynebacterium sp. sy039 TaxID=2599641 RepID=UPI00352D15FA